MMRLRHIVRSALCCLLCLTVCAAPVLAADVTLESYQYNKRVWGFSTSNSPSGSMYYPFQDYGSLAGFDAVSGTRSVLNLTSSSHAAVREYWNKDSEDTGSKVYFLFRFAYPDITINHMDFYVGYYKTTVKYTSDPALDGHTIVPSSLGLSTYGNVYDGSNADGVLIKHESNTNLWPLTNLHCNTDTLYFESTIMAQQQYMGLGSGAYVWPVLVLDADIYSPNMPAPPATLDDILESITVIQTSLDGLTQQVTEINVKTGVIQETIVDMKNQLEDSNSSIWGAFKDSVSGLFVPSSGDLEGVKNGFDQLAQEKLGGAYQTIDLVDDGVKSVVNKFKNPGSSPGVEFPGISVPLGGDTGTVTLAASQTVTIPEQITNVLYPVAGVIIPIVCVIWTIRQCTDMVECFMSGMSYAEFLHRNSDEEDEEV